MSGGGGGPPAQPLAPGNYDRAWNDPPLFSYSASSSTPQSGGGRLLTKRVGFPSSHPPPPGQDPTAPPKLHDAGAKPPSSCLPPPPMMPGPSPSQTPDEVATPATVSVDDTMALYEELARTYLGPEKSKTITARLAVMFQAWREGGLSPRLGCLVADVGSRLSCADLSGAEASYVVLSADYGGEVGAGWVLAIRHILTAATQAQPQDQQEGLITKPL